MPGPKPIDDPSLADDQAEFNKLNNELFGDGTGVHNVGKGTVYAGQSLGDVFNALQVSSRLRLHQAGDRCRLKFVHRKLTDGDLYFVDNRGDRSETVDATFRVTGNAPELWHSDTGSTENPSFTVAAGRTTVPLQLGPWGSVFVVFRRPTTKTSYTAPTETETEVATLNGPWTVSFQADRGAPPQITLDKLISWNDSTDAGVKYFSGAGTYTQTVVAEPAWFKHNAHIWIDLGDVKNLAEITVNGKSLGVVWHAPFRVDATSALKPGANEISIKVINAWVNRLIGDQQPNASHYTFADIKPYKADSPLLPSGLLGPVRLYSAVARREAH